MNDIYINHANLDVSIKFYRRKDLTVETRLYIAFMTLLCNRWGLITQMAKQYAISRTFIYMLQSQLNTAVEDYFYVGSALSKKELTIKGKEKSLEYAFLLRMNLLAAELTRYQYKINYLFEAKLRGTNPLRD